MSRSARHGVQSEADELSGITAISLWQMSHESPLRFSSAFAAASRPAAFNVRRMLVARLRVSSSVLIALGTVVATGSAAVVRAQDSSQAAPAPARQTPSSPRRNDVPIITVRLSDISAPRRDQVRLREGEVLTVWIEEANPLVYTYTLRGETLTEDTLTRNLFRRLIGAAAVPFAPAQGAVSEAVARQRPARCPSVSAASGNDTLRVFAQNVLAFAAALRGLVVLTDEGPPSSGTAQAVRTCVAYATDQLDLRWSLASETLLRHRLDELLTARGAAATSTERELHQLASGAAQAVVFFANQLAEFQYQRVAMRYPYTGGGTVIVGLQIKNKLGDAHPNPAIVTDGPVPLAEVRLREPTFYFSTGLTGVFGTRRVFTIDKVYAAPNPPPADGSAGVDTFRVATTTLNQFSFVPTLFFTWAPVEAWRPGFAVSLGAGLNGGDIKQVDNNIDIMAMVTVGAEWFRVSAGVAYLTQMATVAGLSNENKTTDPNVLTRAERERRLRFAVAVHVRP